MLVLKMCKKDDSSATDASTYKTLYIYRPQKMNHKFLWNIMTFAL